MGHFMLIYKRNWLIDRGNTPVMGYLIKDSETNEKVQIYP